jgi:mRNA interferase MazF
VKIGDIILVPFPFAELTNIKIRPAVVIGITDDKYTDVILSAISSVVPTKISKREIILIPNLINKLRAKSIIKCDRIITLKNENIIARLGKLSPKELGLFREILIEIISKK